MKIFNIGIIGFGYWGNILLKYFISHPGFTVSKIATRHPENIKNLPCFKESGTDYVVKVCSVDSVMEDPEIDAVIVATPIENHYTSALTSLKNGKHVFVEKPLTTKTAQAEELYRISKEKNLKIFTNWTFTFSPGINKMTQLAKNGEIGRVRGFCFNVRQWGRFSPEGVYWDLGCHLLSILSLGFNLEDFNYFRHDLLTRFNPGYEKEDIPETGTIILSPRDPDGVAGVINLSFNYPDKERNLVMTGEEGTLVFNMNEIPSLRMCRYHGENRNQNTFWEFSSDEGNTLSRVVDHFHKLLMGEQEDNIKLSLTITGILEKLEKE